MLLATYYSLRITQGEVGTDVFFILHGSAVVTIDVDGVEQVCSRLGRGSFFGELAASAGTRTATVTASSRLLCAVLPKTQALLLPAAVADHLLTLQGEYTYSASALRFEQVRLMIPY